MKKISYMLTISLALVACQNTTDVDSMFISPVEVIRQEKTTQLTVFTDRFNVLEERDVETSLYVVNNETSMLVYVNKQRQLPDGYVPPDLVAPDVLHYAPAGDDRRLLRKEAAKSLEQLFAEARNSGIELVAVSGYRSYDRQKAIYENNVQTKGQAYTDQFSAKPGTSEHQTGLAMDVSVRGNDAVLLKQSFGDTEAGQYVLENAHRFGFIIRYSKGKEDITGYSYEPWHLRYVGKKEAEEIFNENLTLEEYFGYHYPKSPN